METNLFVYIISHITITGYKTKTTSAFHAFKIHNKRSVVSGLNACPYPEPALTHLRLQYGRAPGEFLAFSSLPGYQESQGSLAVVVYRTFTLWGVDLRTSFFIDCHRVSFFLCVLNFHIWS